MFPEKVVAEEYLPSPEERREILEHARRVLQEACLVTDQLDRLQEELSAGPFADRGREPRALEQARCLPLAALPMFGPGQRIQTAA
jgi:hypothetical protein